jgi:hypothetical protein
MSSTGKIAIGLSLASGALLTAYLLSGNRKAKTKKFISKGTEKLKTTLKTTEKVFDDSEVYYI